MDILIYTLKNRENGAGRVHLEGVLGNLYSMGHSIVYANGKRYSPTPVEELEIEIRGEQQRSIWEQIKRLVFASPLKGEALILWLFLNEVRLFFSAIITVLHHRPDVIYRRHNIFEIDYLIARLFHIPSVKEVNGILVDERRSRREGDKISLWFIDRIERFNMPKADKIVAVTPKLKEVIHSEYKIESNKITIVQNGADTDLFKPMDVINAREELGLAQNINYVCFVGSLKQWQGLEYLIQSLPLILERCPDTQLLIVGEGRIKEELLELAEKTGVLNKTIFTGAVSYHKVPLYISASDVCVAFFRRERNERCGLSPLKLFEYMACGKAVIGSRLSGLEILEQQNAGILVEPENAPELSKATIRLLHDRELSKQMGDNGRRYVVEYQSWEKVAERVADICQSLVNSRRDGNNQ